MDNLIKQVIDSYKKINQDPEHLYNYNVFIYDPKYQKIPDINFDDLYISNTNLNKAYLTLNTIITVTFKQNQKTINVSFYYNKQSQLKHILWKTIIRIRIMVSLFHKSIEKNIINFVILAYELPRIIPNSYVNSPNEFMKIGKEHYFNCTCGWFQSNNISHQVFVSRTNGLLGLLTHELCHLCKLDYGGYDSFSQWKIYYQKNIGYNSGEFTEGINNALSSIFHCIFLMCEDNANDLTLFIKYMNNEINNSAKLCSNILQYFRCNTLHEMMNKHIFIQSGHVFEYIFLRHIYLTNLNKLYHLNFKINKSGEYYNLFINLLERDKYKIKVINKNSNKDKHHLNMEYYFI